MSDQTEKIALKWWAYSKRNADFDIIGYSVEGGDYRVDATKAMETLSKHLKQPIPHDVEIIIIPKD